MVSNSLILWNWKIRETRVWVSNKMLGLFFLLKFTISYYTAIFTVNCLKSLFPNYFLRILHDFQQRLLNCCNFFELEIEKKAVKLIRQWHLRNSVLPPWIPQHLERLQSWLEGSKTPFTRFTVSVRFSCLWLWSRIFKNSFDVWPLLNGRSEEISAKSCLVPILFLYNFIVINIIMVDVFLDVTEKKDRTVMLYTKLYCLEYVFHKISFKWL